MANRRALPVEVARRLRHGRLGRPELRPRPTEGGWAAARWHWQRAAGVMFKGSVVFTAIIGLVKLVLGVVAWSPYVVANGLYSLAMGVARFTCLVTEEDHQSLWSEYQRYRLVGWMVMIASVLYAAYSVRLFFRADPMRFTYYTAIGVATIVFTELVVNIQQAVSKRRGPSPSIHAAKLAGLASSIAALALVQIALRGLEMDTSATSYYDAGGGLFCGGVAALIGLGMIIRATSKLRSLTPSTTDKR